MAKDFRQILQAFEFQGHIILPRKPGFSGPSWWFLFETLAPKILEMGIFSAVEFDELRIPWAN